MTDTFPIERRDFGFAGLRLRSTLALPDAPPWTGAKPVAECLIDAGPVPARLPDPVVERLFLQVGRDGACRYAIPGVAAWWIAPDGGRIVVERDGATDAEMRAFLFGSIMSIVLARRGFLLLHACCLERDGRAIAVCGPSGAGKSTLAANLLRRGFHLLSDDLTVVELRDGAEPSALPTFPRVKLWQDALDRLGLGTDGLERVSPALAKFNRPVGQAFCPEPRPLGGLFVLAEALVPQAASYRRLTAAESLAQMPTALYRGRMVARIGQGARQKQQYLRLLSALGGCVAIRRPEDDEALEMLPRLAA